MDLYIFDTSTYRRFWITVDINDTIEQIKNQIAKKTGLSSHSNLRFQQLTFRNKPLLKDNLTLSDYNIPQNSELHIHYSFNNQHPDIPIQLRMKEPHELRHICCDPTTDIKTQLYCVTLIASTKHFFQPETLVSAICNQSLKDHRRLKVLQEFAAKCEQYYTPFYELEDVDIIEKLNPFCDPLQHYSTLLIVSKMLRKSCEIIGKKESLSFTDDLLQKLNVLAMYSGNEEIVDNAIESYNTLITDGALAQNIKQIVRQSEECKDTLKIQYNAKIERDKRLFEGFVKEYEIIVPKEVMSLIDKYYNCYNDSKYNLIQRLLDVSTVQSGYCNKVRHNALLTIYKLTKFGHVDTITNIIYNYQMLLTLRKILNNFDKDIAVIRVCGATLYNCVLADKYCVFNYDILEPLIQVFVKSGTENQEPIIYILHAIKDKIPTSKMVYLMKRYPFIESMCAFMRYHRWEKDAINRSLRIMEYFFGIQQKRIGALCVATVNQMDDKINIFQRVVNASYDDEISEIANRIITTYFSNK